MDAAQKLMPWASEPLTWEQICERYPDEWVCLVDIDREAPNTLEFKTARVVGHGKTRRAPFEQSEPWWAYRTTMGHYFTGQDEAPTIEEMMRLRRAMR